MEKFPIQFRFNQPFTASTFENDAPIAKFITDAKKEFIQDEVLVELINENKDLGLDDFDGLTSDGFEVTNFNCKPTEENVPMYEYGNRSYTFEFDLKVTSVIYDCIAVHPNNEFTLIDRESFRVFNFKLSKGINAFNIDLEGFKNQVLKR